MLDQMGPENLNKNSQDEMMGIGMDEHTDPVRLAIEEIEINLSSFGFPDIGDLKSSADKHVMKRIKCF